MAKLTELEYFSFQLDFPYKGCTDAYVCGIATDVCVGRSHKQALKCLVGLNSDALNLKSMYRINPLCDWKKTQTNALSWLSRARLPYFLQPACGSNVGSH